MRNRPGESQWTQRSGGAGQEASEGREECVRARGGRCLMKAICREEGSGGQELTREPPRAHLDAHAQRC